MHDLIKQLREELYAKAIPGKVLNDLMEDKLKELSSRYEHDSEALWIGAYLADIRIVEARTETGKHENHVPMAAEYAKELFKKHSISKDQQEIILEIIEKHHEKGPYKHIETQLFTNADCFKFLEPKGAFHLFGAMYSKNNQDFDASMQSVMFKAEEKYELVDLDDETKKEADMLYKRLKWMFDRIGVEEATPEVYRTN